MFQVLKKTKGGAGIIIGKKMITLPAAVGKTATPAALVRNLPVFMLKRRKGIKPRFVSTEDNAKKKLI